MSKERILALTIKRVRDASKDENAGHDWWHTYRVWKTALRIAKQEKGADLFIVQLGALLHDIADWKFTDKKTLDSKPVNKWLEKAGADKDTVARVAYIVNVVAFKGSGVKDNVRSKEAAVIQDADRLDALGAIGVARAFGYGGYRKRPMYDPNEKIKYHRSFTSYKTNQSRSTVNHFYEKLLLLKSRMKTKEGKKLAKERDAFLRQYLRRFFEEWKGKE